MLLFSIVAPFCQRKTSGLHINYFSGIFRLYTWPADARAFSRPTHFLREKPWGRGCICPQGVRIWLLFHRKFINCLLKHCAIWKQGQFQHALKAAQISQNWKKTSKRNCSEILQKVARNTASWQKVGGQNVESPREKERGGGVRVRKEVFLSFSWNL